MKKSLRTTLVLGIVLVGLVVWYNVYEKKFRPEHEKAEEQAKTLVALKLEAIQYLTVERHELGNQAGTPNAIIKLKKTGNDWGLLEPIADGGDNATVATILNALTTTKYDRVVEDKPKDLAGYGLKDPFLKVTVAKDATTPGETILVGDDTPVGAGVYVKTLKSEAVYKMPSSFKASLNKKLFDLRNKKIVDFPKFELGEIEIQMGKDTFLLTKGEKDEWTLARENIPAETAAVNKLLSAIVDTRAKAFASENGSNLSAYGLNPPTVKVGLTKSKEKTRESLWVGKTKDKYYAKREDKKTIYEVDKSVFDKLIKPAASYRSLELAKFNRFEVKRLRLERGHELLELVKEDTGWSMPSEPKFKVDSAKVDNLIAQIQDTKAQKYLTKGDTKLVNSPVLIVSVFEKTDAKDKPKVKLTFGKKLKDLVPVMRQGLDLPFEIKDSDFLKIDLSKHVFEKAPETPKASSEHKGPGKALENGKSEESETSS